MTTYELSTRLLIPRPRAEVFAFFADAANLEVLTPPWLRFHILTPRPVAMHPGALIDYRLRVRGFPVRWRTRITVWEPPERFVDEQLKGPYKLWHHEHTFTERPDGTEVGDHVRYAVPGGPLSPLIHRFLVARDVQTIFAWRTRKLQEIFEFTARPEDQEVKVTRL